MRVLPVAIGLLLVAAPAAAQRKVAERLPAAPDGYVRVHNIAGSVKLIGWDRDSVAVTGTVHDTPNERFTVQRDGDGVTVGLWDSTVERAEPSSIEVRVPTRSRVWVRTGSASVYVEGVTGSVDVTSVGGMIEMRGRLDEVFAESMTGSITIDAQAPLVRAKTVTGALLLSGSYADASASSVSGNILLEDTNIERGRFETVDGELRFVGSLRRDAVLDMITHGGAVEFLLPAATNADFAVSTYEGSVRSEFDVPVRTEVSKVKGSQRSFRLGDGGARVNVRTFRGRVVIRSR